LSSGTVIGKGKIGSVEVAEFGFPAKHDAEEHQMQKIRVLALQQEWLGVMCDACMNDGEWGVSRPNR
jgi:hypothetical protein